MSGLETLTIALVAVWLGALTLVTILLVRQVALLSVRIALPTSHLLVSEDGPQIGTQVPEDVAPLLSLNTPHQTHLLVLSAGCKTCRELASALNRRKVTADVSALITGPEKPAAALAAQLPAEISVVRDPDATRVVEALRIQSRPFALALERGRIVRKAYLWEEGDFDSFLDDGRSQGNGEVGQAQEVTGV